MMTLLDPDQLWWVHWRIHGGLCGNTLVPIKTMDAVDLMEKASAVYGKHNVWMEKDFVSSPSPTEQE